MSQRIIDVFEPIQIQKDHGSRFVLAECVIWTDMSRAALTSWKTITAPVTRPARSWIGAAESSMADSCPSRRMSTQFTVSPTVLFCSTAISRGSRAGLARGSVNNSEDFGEAFASGFFTAPARHGLCNKIEIGDIPGNVGTENGVANRGEGDHGAFFFDVQGILDDLAFDRIAQCARQRIAIEVTSQEIIL